MNRVSSGARGQLCRPKSGITLLELLMVIGVLLVLLAFLLPPVTRSREAARRTQCKNNLKQIGLALHNYKDVYGVFPPAYTVDADGNPLHSWRTLLLPYLDQKALYDQIDLSKPWDDFANAKFAAEAPHCFHCPSTNYGNKTDTTYVAVVTPESCIRPGESLKFSEVTDGTSNTIVVLEIPLQHAVHWMSPKDANDAIVMSFRDDPKSAHTGGIHVLLIDGAVRFVSGKVDPKVLKALTTAAAGDKIEEF